jgi:hypothetical protein
MMIVKKIVQVYNDIDGQGFTAFLKSCAGLYIFCKEKNYECIVTYKNSCLEPFLLSDELQDLIPTNYIKCSSISILKNVIDKNINNEILYVYCYGEIEGYMPKALIDIYEIQQFINKKCLTKTSKFQQLYNVSLEHINIIHLPYIVLYIRAPDINLDDINAPISISNNLDIELFIQYLKKNILLDFLVIVSTSYQVKKELQEKYNITVTPTIPIRLLQKNLQETKICPSNGIIDFFILLNASTVVCLPIGTFYGGYAQTAYLLKNMDYYESFQEFVKNFEMNKK